MMTKSPAAIAAPPASVIVADDDKSVRLVIAQALKKQGYIVHTAATAAGMWDLSVARKGALLITDVGFPDGDALDMLPRLQRRLPDLKVIVMSARANLLTAVQSRQRGVIDYLPKPFELKQLIETTKKALAQVVDNDKDPAVPTIEAPTTIYAPLLGRSPVMQEVYKTLARLSAQIVPVLIESEPGSGKADVARALHDMAGHHDAPYIEMNCAQLLQNEHVSHLFDAGGAIDQANGGTLFINNIEQLETDAQLHFMRVLEAQSKAPDAWPKRLLIGVKEDLRIRVDNDEFREDLFFALSVAPIKLPALRERIQDLPAIVHHFCDEANESFSSSCSFDLSAISALQEYSWPGNIKELEFTVRRLVMSANSAVIEARHVYRELGAKKHSSGKMNASSLSEAADQHIRNYFMALGDNLPPEGLYERIIEEIERPLIIRTLHLTKGNQIKAAQILGLNRNTLRKKIDLLNISKDRSDYKDRA